MSEAVEIRNLRLVWGTPGDIEMDSDGGGEYASTFRLSPRGVAKIAQALGVERYLFAEFCSCPEPRRDGDGIHVPGEPSDDICLASPLPPGLSDQLGGTLNHQEDGR